MAASTKHPTPVEWPRLGTEHHDVRMKVGDVAVLDEILAG
jgi:hypothetical protein